MLVPLIAILLLGGSAGVRNEFTSTCHYRVNDIVLRYVEAVDHDIIEYFTGFVKSAGAGHHINELLNVGARKLFYGLYFELDKTHMSTRLG